MKRGLSFSTKYNHRCPLLLAANLLAAASAVAGDQAAAPNSTSPPPSTAGEGAPAVVQITASAGDLDPRRRDTASKIVVPHEEILKYGDRTISDTLKRLPGITVGGGIRMRGLGEGYTQILLNGDPTPPGFSLDSVAPEMIERIEILRVATADISNQAIAGTINIVLRKAIPNTAQRQIKTGLFYDTAPGAFANLEFSDKFGQLAYVIVGSITQGRYGYQTDSGESATDASGNLIRQRIGLGRFDVRLAGINLAPRVTWSSSPEDAFIWQTFLKYNTNKVAEFQNIQVLSGVLPPFGQTNNSNALNVHSGKSDLNWIHKFQDGARLDAKFGVGYTRQSTRALYESFDFMPQLALNSNYRQNNIDRQWGVSGKYSTPVLANHELVLGWDGSWSQRTEQRLRIETSPIGLTPDNIDEDARATVRRLAVFAQDEWTFTPRWSVYAGLRWEGIETTAGLAGDASAKNTSSVWSPVLQTLYKLPDSKDDQLRLAVGRTYKAPTTFALLPRHVLQRDNSSINPDQQGNPQLKPELSFSVDASYEHFIAGGGVFSIGAYGRRIDNVTRTLITLDAGRWVSMAHNSGNARVYGIETDLKLPLRSLIKTWPAIELRANLTRNWSDIDVVPGPNNRLDAQIPLSSSIGIDYAEKGKSFALGATYSYQGAGDARISEQQFKSSSASRRLDAYLLHKFSDKRQVRISLNNLLHQPQYRSARYLDLGGNSVSFVREPSYTLVRIALELKL